MRTLSILQPYAWLIVNGHKDIENRTWATQFRGRIFVHAGKRYSRADHEDDQEFFYEAHGIALPDYKNMPLGGIVGAVDIVDCVTKSDSEWFNEGGYGFVLRNPQVLPFMPYRGQLGFFDVQYQEDNQP